MGRRTLTQLQQEAWKQFHQPNEDQGKTQLGRKSSESLATWAAKNDDDPSHRISPSHLSAP